MLYLWYSGSCGGGPLSTLGGVTGSGGIVWTTRGESTLVCVHVGSGRGEIIGTLRSGIVTCGIGGVGMGRTGVYICNIYAS